MSGNRPARVSEQVAAMTDAVESQNLYHGRYGTTPAGSATARAILSCLRNHHGLTLVPVERPATPEPESADPITASKAAADWFEGSDGYVRAPLSNEGMR